MGYGEGESFSSLLSDTQSIEGGGKKDAAVGGGSKNVPSDVLRVPKASVEQYVPVKCPVVFYDRPSFRDSFSLVSLAMTFFLMGTLRCSGEGASLYGILRRGVPFVVLQIPPC